MGTLKKQGYSIPGIFGIDYYTKLWISEVQHKDFDFMLDWTNRNITWEKNNLESFWKKYNCFTLEHPTMQSLKKDIHKEYINFMLELGEEPEEIYVNGWFNVYEFNQGQRPHYHNYSDSSYLSGIVVLTENDSYTDFLAPAFPKIVYDFENQFNYDVIEVKNHLGQLIFFPQWTYHGVKQLKENKKRVTIGFDIFTKDGMKIIKKSFDKNHMYNQALKLSE